MSGPSSITRPFERGRAGRLEEVLEALDYKRGSPPPHAQLLRVGEGVRVTLYRSGKLLIQGKRAGEVLGELQAFGLVGGAPAPAASARPSEGARVAKADAAAMPTTVGSDETGKGDFFGRLVVAACRVDEATLPYLRDLGVQDSKKLTDPRALTLARAIRKRCPCEVLAITPARYNELYAKFRNLNHLLAWAHGRAIEALLEKTDAERIVVDQFAKDERLVADALGDRGRELLLIQRPRGEEEPAVAAASVLARATFLETLDELGKTWDLTLPKGASKQVEAAGRAFVAKHGRANLGEVAKLHFKTADRV